MISADPAEIRKACGIRQSTVARALGISPAHVSFLERGIASPRAVKTDAFARVIAGMARHLETDEENR